MRFFCISIYCVYVVSLHIESTDSMITGNRQNLFARSNYPFRYLRSPKYMAHFMHEKTVAILQLQRHEVTQVP